LTLEIGTVFRWDHFPIPRYGGKTKPRWFISLGETGPFSQLAILSPQQPHKKPILKQVATDAIMTFLDLKPDSFRYLKMTASSILMKLLTLLKKTDS